MTRWRNVGPERGLSCAIHVCTESLPDKSGITGPKRGLALASVTRGEVPQLGVGAPACYDIDDINVGSERMSASWEDLNFGNSPTKVTALTVALALA